MANDVIYTEPRMTPATPAWDLAWNDQLERWLAGHLDIQKNFIFDAVIEAVGDLAANLEAKREVRLHSLELRLAECMGAVNVLRIGRVMHVKGTYRADADYKLFDVVAYGGSSFVATADDPGEIPGPNWQLLASAGGRGRRGERGEKGEPGAATDVPGFKALRVDQANYTISLFTSDGQIHKLDLKPLFQQFLTDVRGDR
jgi:hypothetical protein